MAKGQRHCESRRRKPNNLGQHILGDLFYTLILSYVFPALLNLQRYDTPYLKRFAYLCGSTNQIDTIFIWSLQRKCHRSTLIVAVLQSIYSIIKKQGSQCFFSRLFHWYKHIRLLFVDWQFNKTICVFITDWSFICLKIFSPICFL